MVVWDREYCLKEAAKQLEDKDVYEDFQNDPSALVNTITRALEKIRIRGDFCNDTLDYFLVKDPKFASFYILPKIHKRLHNVPGKSILYRKYLLISRPSFATYSSEKEFIHKRHKPRFTKN